MLVKFSAIARGYRMYALLNILWIGLLWLLQQSDCREVSRGVLDTYPVPCANYNHACQYFVSTLYTGLKNGLRLFSQSLFVLV